MVKRICVFGDSVAWGAYLPKREAWTDLLRNYLDGLSHYSIELYNQSIDGDLSKDILFRFDTEAKARKPDAIIIAVGVNDSIYRANDQFEVSEMEFIDNLRQIVEKARVFTDKIWCMGLVKGSDESTIPLTVSTTGKCYSKSVVKKYDGFIKKFVTDQNIPFVDVFSELSDTDFDDGLHPNLQGHVKIFDIIRKMFDEQRIMEFLLSKNS